MKRAGERGRAFNGLLAVELGGADQLDDMLVADVGERFDRLVRTFVRKRLFQYLSEALAVWAKLIGVTEDERRELVVVNHFVERRGP